jgi:general secretion pathway protein D
MSVKRMQSDRMHGNRCFNRVVLFCLGLLLVLPISVYAQSETSNAQPPKAQTNATKDARFVSIDFNNVDINVFIKFISELTGQNFVIDQRVKGKVTIISPAKISVTEAYKVFQSVLEVHGFTTVKAGEVTKILPAPDARSKSIETRIREGALSPQDRIITQLIPLRFANPAEIKRLFTPLISKSSVILAYNPTNTLIVTDVESNIKRLMRLLDAIDVTGTGQKISVLPIEYADATKLVKILGTVFKTTAKTSKTAAQKTAASFIADERTNAIVLLASDVDTKRVKELIALLDKETPRGKGNINVYYLEHAIAEDVAKVLQDIPQKEEKGGAGKKVAPVVSDKVRITADKATNALIITADKEDYEVIQDIIKKIDIPRTMVYIEALIMEVNINKDFQIGAEWQVGKEVEYDNKSGVAGGGFRTGSVIPSIDATTGLVGLPVGMSLGVFGESLNISGITFPTIQAMVKAYQKDKDVHILSTPQIVTTDNQEAKIYVGSNVPFQTQATTSNNDTYNSFEYRDVGKTLKITPHINKDGMVRLDISLEISDVDTQTTLLTTSDRPITLKRNIETTVIVKDTNTVVLGGLIDDSFSVTETKVPCLGDVPLLGWLFKTRSKGTEKTNLYFFLTPRVIRGPEEADAVYGKKRSHIDSLKAGEVVLSGDEAEPMMIEGGPPPVKEIIPAPDPESPPEPDNRPFSPSTRDEDDASDAGQNPLMEPEATAVDEASSTAEAPTQPEPAAHDGAVDTGEGPATSATGMAVADAEPVSADERSRTEGRSTGENYTLQLGSFKTSAQAGRMRDELVDQGFPAYVYRKEVDGASWYRVRVGTFNTRSDLIDIKARLESEGYNPLIMKKAP